MGEIVRLSCSKFPEPDFITTLLASLQFTLDSNQLLGILKSLYSEYFVNIIYLPLWVFHSSTQSDNGPNPGKETSWKKSFKYPWQPCSARQFVYIDFIRTQTKNYEEKNLFWIVQFTHHNIQHLNNISQPLKQIKWHLIYPRYVHIFVVTLEILSSWRPSFQW